MFIDNLIHIQDVLVRNEVTETRFACDLVKCKGACCTFKSDFGAPLLENEIEKIEEVLPYAIEYLSDNNKKEIEQNGFYEVKSGELMTRSINKKDCVFVYYENDIAKCSMEKAYNEGKTNYKKPISCHLFPIRISKFGGDIVRFEEFSECKPALEKGIDEKINLVDFCKEPLVRLYGKKWYLKLKEQTEK